MTAQDFILGARVAHLRELKTEIERLKRDNAVLRDENQAIRSHLDLALLALAELQTSEGLEIWDGWNLILGAGRVASSRADLVAQAKATGRRVWIVFDGHDERVRNDGLVRVSYTGGSGDHRADRFIIDFIRAAVYLGLKGKIILRTDDRDFRAEVDRICISRDFVVSYTHSSNSPKGTTK